MAGHSGSFAVSREPEVQEIQCLAVTVVGQAQKMLRVQRGAQQEQREDRIQRDRCSQRAGGVPRRPRDWLARSC